MFATMFNNIVLVGQQSKTIKSCKLRVYGFFCGPYIQNSVFLTHNYLNIYGSMMVRPQVETDNVCVVTASTSNGSEALLNAVS